MFRFERTENQTRLAALQGLAIFGFLALVALGMWLAISSARYVPTAVSKLSAAAVALSSVFTPAPEPVATSTPVIVFGEDAFATSTTPTTTPVTKPVATSAGTPSSNTYLIGGTPSGTAPLSGLADLTVEIKAVGYLSGPDATTFTASSSIPSTMRPAVKFVIKNIGTNATGAWRFTATIPTQTAYIYESVPQQNLNPGDSIEYTLGFDQANRGANQTISISVNKDRAISESNTDNNNAAASVTILGS